MQPAWWSRSPSLAARRPSSRDTRRAALHLAAQLSARRLTTCGFCGRRGPRSLKDLCTSVSSVSFVQAYTELADTPILDATARTAFPIAEAPLASLRSAPFVTRTYVPMPVG